LHPIQKTMSTRVTEINLTGKFKKRILLILFKFIKSYLYNMTENSSLLLKDAQATVSDLILTKVSKTVRFHTLQHTQEVVAASELIAGTYQLPEDDRLALFLAAWFHDTGYSSGRAKDHETGSIQLATDFLNAHGISEDLKSKIIGCINATRIPQSPMTTIERIICDADLFHLGTDDFKEKNRLLREELLEFGGEEYSKKEWRKSNIEFLEKHQYFTNYGKEKLQPVKEKNIAELKEKKRDEMKNDKPDKKEKGKGKEKSTLGLSPQEAADAKIKKDKEKEADRGIATVFRIMASNHSALSQMADTKANILISVNSIIASIIISSLFDKLQTDTYLQIPVGLIVAVCVSSIVFGILATRPNVSGGTFTREDIANKKTNLLFFGNFHNMSLPDYDWGMTEMMSDKAYLYSSMIKDNYFLGVVLAKKYRYLRIAYNIFMYGLILSMLAFAISVMLPSATEVYAPG
jgi:predicted metal-dependent HD superfamily phosphohydrolase